MSYKHGVHIYEQPTSIVPPVRIGAGLPVFVGTAPVNQTDITNVNKPVLCYSYKEAVAAFGFSKDFDKFTLCEAIYSQFALFKAGNPMGNNMTVERGFEFYVIDGGEIVIPDEHTFTLVITVIVLR